MNIIINNYCNYKCEYCFANKVLEKNKMTMSIENYKQVLLFLKKSSLHEARIIGGEPTLHPQFDDILIETMTDENIRKILIFTNGSYNENVSKMLCAAAKAKHVSLLINYNEPEVIGERLNNITIKNIDNAIKNNIDVALGVNIYKQGQNFDYLIDIAKQYGLKKIRCSIAVPNSIEKENEDMFLYYSKYIKTFVDFVENCYVNNISIGIDCNKIPICSLDDKTLRYIMSIDPTIFSEKFCNPVLDVQPDLTVIRCFSASEKPVKLLDFQNANEIVRYFDETIDKKIKTPTLKLCNNCPTHNLYNKSCGCLKFNKDFQTLMKG